LRESIPNCHGPFPGCKIVSLEKYTASNPHALRLAADAYWQERLRAARLQYDLASTESSRVIDDQRRWPRPAPDGSASLRNARLKESAAREEYRRILRIFTDLTVYGKSPEPDPPDESA